MKIEITVNGSYVSAEVGATVSEVINGERPCGGHGSCGKCRVVARGALSEPSPQEKTRLTAEEMAKGVRLACLARVLGACEVFTADSESNTRIISGGELSGITPKPEYKKYGAAVDIGTTTLAACLYDAEGKRVSEATRLNPQQCCGADVVSRIEAAIGGKAEELSRLIRKAVSDLISELADSANIPATDVENLVITGNTVMLSLLTGEDVEPFSHAPFAVGRLFGETLTAGELELSRLSESTPVYLPPCISAFVGADTVCAIVATGLCESKAAMLADIGTNGELALWHDGGLSVCSTAAGPAFEGVGIAMGMRGADGAIDAVELVDGELSAHVIGDISPRGICGSGLVDAVAAMLDAELVDESGYLEDGECVIKSPVYITQADIRMLQLAKSAICAGLLTLVKEKGVTTGELTALYVAGGFGSYLNMESAVKIGLLPKELAEISRVVGNAALSGAVMLLLEPERRKEAAQLASGASVSELSTSGVFSDKYMMGMMLTEQYT